MVFSCVGYQGVWRIKRTPRDIGDATTDEQGRPCFYVSRGDDPQVYLLRDTTIARIKQGFGRT